jgi:hypothetical protein
MKNTIKSLLGLKTKVDAYTTIEALHEDLDSIKGLEVY